MKRKLKALQDGIQERQAQLGTVGGIAGRAVVASIDGLKRQKAAVKKTIRAQDGSRPGKRGGGKK